MNNRYDIVLSYIFLPCDVKRIIKDYCCNSLGYTGEELAVINRECYKRRGKKLRTLAEAMHFKKMGVSTSWLKSIYHEGLLYGSGAYLSSYGEIRIIEDFYRRGEITIEQLICIYEEIYIDVSNGMKYEIKSIIKRMYPEIVFTKDDDGKLTNSVNNSVYHDWLKRMLIKS